MREPSEIKGLEPRKEMPEIEHWVRVLLDIDSDLPVRHVVQTRLLRLGCEDTDSALKILEKWMSCEETRKMFLMLVGFYLR